jgi:hypothetical protein
MDQLFNVNGRFLPFEQAQKIMAEKRGETPKEEAPEIKEEVPEKEEEEPVETPVDEPDKEVIISSEFICDVCQKVCKSKAGLAVHQLKHK